MLGFFSRFVIACGFVCHNWIKLVYVESCRGLWRGGRGAGSVSYVGRMVRFVSQFDVMGVGFVSHMGQIMRSVW